MNKKILFLGLSVIILLLIFNSGCIEDGNNDENNKNDTDSFELTITNIEKTEFNETEGYRVIYLNVTIENTQNEEMRITPGNFYLVLEDEKEYDPIYFDNNIFGDLPTDETIIEPGQKINTYFGFKVFSKYEPDHLYYGRGSFSATAYA